MKKIVAILLACLLLSGCQSILPFLDSGTESGRGSLLNPDLVVEPSYDIHFDLPEGNNGTVENIQTEAATTAPTEPSGYGMATVSATDLNIRSGPGTGFATAGQIPYGSRIRIFDISFSNGVPWGRFDEGWLCMDYVTLDDPSAFPVDTHGNWSALTLITPTVSRSGPGKDYPISSSSPVNTIMEFTGKVGQWYKYENGWIHEDHIYLYGTTTEEAPLSVIVTVTDLNLRAHPNTTSKIIRTLRKDQELEILFQVTLGSMRWGCTKDGWVCMDYVEEVQNNPLIGAWYHFEMNWWTAADFEIRQYAFTKDGVFTETYFDYDPASDSFTANAVTTTRKYTYKDSKIFFDNNLYGSSVTINGNTLEYEHRVFTRGTAQDSTAEIQKIMAKAKQNAQTNDPAILGSWQRMDYIKDTMTFPLGCDYTFYENGTYVLGTVAEGVGTYDPETGKVSWRSGTGSCCESGIYTFDGSTLKLECYGAERYSYTEVEDKTIAASVEGDVLTIYGEKAYHGTLEEIVARLMAEAQTP